MPRRSVPASPPPAGATAPPLPPEAAAVPPVRKWLALLGIGSGVLLFTIDASIVHVALPTLVEQLGTTYTTIQWVVLSYLLVVTALTPGAARLGDMRGKKRLYVRGLVLFTAGSVLCGLAPTVEWLIAFRALQGLGAVGASALGAAIIAEVFPPEERGRALGAIGAIVSLGIALGPSVGGLILGVASWHWLFLVNLPVGVGAVWLVRRVVPESAPRPGQRLDVPGAVLAAGLLTAFALGMTFGQRLGFGHPLALALLAASALTLAAFVRVERRAPQPMLDLALFAHRPLSVGLLMGWLVFVVLAGTLFIMPFFLELVLGYTPAQVGLLLAVSPIMAGLASPVSGWLSDRFGPRPISLAGLALMTAGCLLIATFHAGMTAGYYVACYVPFGLGLGMFQSPNSSAILSGAPRDRLGVASGLLSLSRTVGQSVGFPLMGALFLVVAVAAAGGGPTASIEALPAAGLVAGVRGTFHVAAGLLGAGIALTLALWGGERRAARRAALNGAAASGAAPGATPAG